MDRVFVQSGARAFRPETDPEAQAWATVRGGMTQIVFHRPEKGLLGIRADHVELMARELFGEQAAPRILQRIREEGGLILDL